MMTARSLLLQPPCSPPCPSTAFAQASDDIIAAPVLRANVTVESDVVRIGDVIDNAGTSAQIAIYRAPDLGTTGSLPTAQVIAALQAHQVIGVDTRDIKAVSVTRLSRTARGQGDRTPGRPCARASQRPRRRRQPQPDLRPRRAGCPAGGVEHRRPAAGRGPLRAAQRPLRRQLRNQQRDQQRADQDCALPASRSKPWRPRC